VSCLQILWFLPTLSWDFVFSVDEVGYDCRVHRHDQTCSFGFQKFSKHGASNRPALNFWLNRRAFLEIEFLLDLIYL